MCVNYNFRYRVCLKWGTPDCKPWGDNLPSQGTKNKESVSERFSSGWHAEYKSVGLFVSPPRQGTHPSRGQEQNCPPGQCPFNTHSAHRIWSPGRATAQHMDSGSCLRPGLTCWGWRGPQRSPADPPGTSVSGPPAIRFPNHQSLDIKLLCFTLRTPVNYVGFCFYLRNDSERGQSGVFSLQCPILQTMASILEHWGNHVTEGPQDNSTSRLPFAQSPRSSKDSGGKRIQPRWRARADARWKNAPPSFQQAPET